MILNPVNSVRIWNY